jgi:hypothetical protein
MLPKSVHAVDTVQGVITAMCPKGNIGTLMTPFIPPDVDGITTAPYLAFINVIYSRASKAAL